MNRRIIVPFISVFFYIAIYFIVTLLKPPSQDHIRELNQQVQTKLSDLIHNQHLQYIPLYYNQKRQEDSQQHTELSLKEQKEILSHGEAKDHIDWNIQNIDTEELLFEKSTSYSLYHSFNESYFSFYSEKEIPKTCLSIKKKKSQEKIFCNILRGLRANLKLIQVKSHQNISKLITEVLKFDDWNGLFLVYAITAQAIRQKLPENITVISSLPSSFEITNILSNLKYVLDASDIHHYINSLKPIDNKEYFVAEIRNLTQQFVPREEVLGHSYILHHISSFQLALNISMGMNTSLTSIEFAGIIRFWHQVSGSIGLYYKELGGEVELQHMKSWLDEGKVYYFLLGAAIVMIYLICQIDTKKKVKRQFRHAFPPSAFKIE